jgi:prephenate dehydrogenase
VSAAHAAGAGRVAICGGGLIGSSLALALATRGRTVAIHDRDATVREALRSLARAATTGTIDVLDDWSVAADGAEVVVAAVPPPVVAPVLAAAARVAPAALLTDVASVKGAVVDEVLAALTDVPGAAERFVGGHPMAGSERSGPLAADATLLSGATWVLTPTPHTSDAMLAAASDLARDL